MQYPRISPFNHEFNKTSRFSRLFYEIIRVFGVNI